MHRLAISPPKIILRSACVACILEHLNRFGDAFSCPWGKVRIIYHTYLPFPHPFCSHPFSLFCYFIDPICFQNSAALTVAFCGRRGEFPAVSKLSPKHAALFYSILTYISSLFFIYRLINKPVWRCGNCGDRGVVSLWAVASDVCCHGKSILQGL